MRKISFMLFLCFFVSAKTTFGQIDVIQNTKHSLDSILQNIEKTKDDDKRFKLILSIYNTAVEGYPVLLLETAQRLYKISQKNNSLIDQSSAMSLYGQSYRLSGNYVKGLEYHLKAIALAEKTGIKSLLSVTQNQMGHIYKDREENEKALRIYLTALENAKKGKTVEANHWPITNLAYIYLAMNMPDSALFYAKQAESNYYIKRQDINNMPYAYYIIAGAYSKMGNKAQAKAYFKLSEQSSIESQSKRYLYYAYIGQAEHYQRHKQMDSSIHFSKKAIDAVTNTDFSYLSMKPAKMLTDLYETINVDSTIKYLRIYRAANDSLFNTRANQQLQMMTIEEDQRQQEMITEKLNYKNSIRTYMMLAGLGVFTLIAMILYRNNRQKQKANKVLESTLSNLKSTQSQLIQSEKMASLGELTAGIAHEIQNPLNFVNNFSEVNTELIDELEQEVDKGNLSEVKAITKDIKENEQKINHHGKRADSIVKGMLQHSRSSSGVKEPTDINALADEYLRLAYHGLRAKDKSFNATLKTGFDESIGTINIIPQDIGRVILNLLTNAFYVVDEKKKSGIGNYEPTVTVSTKKTNNKIEITVTDNGNGIPQKIADKIFQPFFTTKPTGQGTGLGLSLSYDIVKAHKGELSVISEVGEGCSFTILLPIISN
jgi:signal transduction histidine kinase